MAHVFGLGPLTDVFTAALRGPNVLQVLFGEQSLSAAFIPIYSRFLERGREEDAGRFAGAIFGLLLVLSSTLALVGVLAARPLVALLAPGFLADAAQVAAGELAVDRYELAVTAVRWVFPMTALLVPSAWCLGVLNSHRRFFLPYFAPVLWNLAIVSSLSLAALYWITPEMALAAISRLPEELMPAAEAAARSKVLLAGCIGALVGGALQFGVQLPVTLRLLKGFRLSLSTKIEGVREAAKAFGPAVAGRGVVQLSLYLDQLLASLAAVGALSAVRWGSFLYALPISLFGIAVAAAELPELSRASSREAHGALVQRTRSSLAQASFLTVPTTVGYLVFGWLLVGAVYRTGAFTAGDQLLVTLVLAAYTLGLPASVTSRLLQNVFWALGDTHTPARVAGLRVAVAVAVGAPLMFALDRIPAASVARDLGFEGLAAETGSFLVLGAAGLALGSCAGSWTELLRLRGALKAPLPELALPLRAVARHGLLALASAGAGALLWSQLPPWPVAAQAALVVPTYALLYLGIARLLKMEELDAWLGSLRRRR